MGLKFEVIGEKKGPFYLDYNWHKLALYALSVGANVDEELEYVYEKDMKVVPTYWASILGFEEFTDSYECGQYLPETLHYGFDITYHKPIIKTEGQIHYHVKLLHIYDRGEGRGSLAEVIAVAYDEQENKIFTLMTRDIDLSSGGFGGETPPKVVVSYPDRAPDFEIEDYIGSNQAAIYRIDNDSNILHIDPDFAKLGGFDKPIIMGMCTAGYACRAIIKAICPTNPESIKSFGVRFTSALEPGNPIKTQIWNLNENEVVFRLINSKTGDVVLNYCTATLS